MALAFLKMYTGLSAPKLMEALNGNIHYQIFCGIRISPESQLTNYKLIDSILLELSRKLKIQEQQKLLADAWKPYMKSLDTMCTDASCYDTLDIDKLNEDFFEYINYGGYPEVVFSEKIKENPGQYIKNDIVEKVLLRDLPSLYGISDIQELNKLFLHIAFRSGNEFSYETLSSEAGIKKDTIKKYLEYLEAAFLIKVVNRIDQTAKKMQRVTSMKIYLTNPTLRCALYTPISESDDACGEMVETAIYDQWILGDKTNFYYANWSKGREKGEVDIVWVENASQKAFSLAEIKWTDKFYEDPSQLKSLRKFLEVNDGIRKIIVTTKSKLGSATIDGNTFLFIPSALYAYWVSKYLFEDKTNQILLSKNNV